MGSTFNPQILVEKLAKLNNSQQSIETLSHWCIFHMNKAKLVVETWERQFHSSSREQKLSFLYLANDILQNSRRKGVEFVSEFWRVLPEALRDVIRNGDDAGRNAAFRLISIWDERKVFGSRGHSLKEEFMGSQPENSNRSGRQLSAKLKQCVGNTLDKIVSDYEVVNSRQSEEDAILNRCSSMIISLEKVVKEFSSGEFSILEFGGELQAQHAALRECIEQLTAVEASRASLVLHLKEALQEQELKLEKVRGQLRAAQLQSEQVANVCRQFTSSDNMLLLEDQDLKEAHASSMPPGFTSAPVVYTRQVPLSDKSVSAEDDSGKSVAAAMAAKLTSSTNSAEMLSHVLTSLASGGMLSTPVNESLNTNDLQQPEKRAKLENGQFSFSPPPPSPPPPPPPPPPPENQEPPPPLPPFPYPDSLYPNATNGEQPQLPPPLPSSPPPMMPLPPMPPYPMAPQFYQTDGSMSNMTYNYVSPPPPLQGYPSAGIGPQVTGMSPYGPPVPYQTYQSSEGVFYVQTSSVPMAPISRQQTL